MSRAGLLVRCRLGVVLGVVGTTHACVVGVLHGIGAFVLAMVITAVVLRAIAIDESAIKKVLGK